MVSNLVVEIAIYNFDLISHRSTGQTLLNTMLNRSEAHYIMVGLPGFGWLASHAH